MPKWIKNLGASAAANVNLVCFHHSGGGANGYRGWRANLPAEIALYGVQLPGREERFTEPLIEDFETLVAAVLKTVCKKQLHQLDWTTMTQRRFRISI